MIHEDILTCGSILGVLTSVHGVLVSIPVVLVLPVRRLLKRASFYCAVYFGSLHPLPETTHPFT